MKKLHEVGELELIRRLTRGLRGGRGVATGIGDDAAVVRVPGSRMDLVYTTDAVIEGTHFLASADPARVGHKAAARVLSDCAAMGAAPLYLLVDLVAPGTESLGRLEKIYRGMHRTARRHGAAIIGGDTAKGPVLELHVFGVGEVPRGRALLRSGARAGDVLFVTGSLGGSLQGRHLRFEPRVREAAWLRAGRWARAMIDLSDGMATDLRHILARSGVGAELEAGRLPRSRGVKSPENALFDGEDFELLFTVPPARAAALEKAWAKAFPLRLTRIGRITRERGVLRVRWTPGGPADVLAARSFEHFRRRV